MSEREETEFDRKLTQAMRKVDAPAGFTDSVMAKIEAAPKNGAASRGKLIVMQPRARAWMSGAIAAALALSVFAGEQAHQRHERELATQQFETATRITDQALAHARAQMAKAGVPLE